MGLDRIERRHRQDLADLARELPGLDRVEQLVVLDAAAEAVLEMDARTPVVERRVARPSRERVDARRVARRRGLPAARIALNALSLRTIARS